MKLSVLRNLPQIDLPDEVIAAAAADEPGVMCDSRGKKISSHKYNAYAYGAEYDGLLRISIFATESVRLGVHQPMFEIFLDYRNRQFATFDLNAKKWRESMILNLPVIYRWNGKKIWFGEESNKLIKTRLSVSEDGISGIMEFQKSIRNELLALSRKRQTDPWDKELEVIPDTPKDWIRFCQRRVISDHFIFYEYSKTEATVGHCSRCERSIPISKPKHNGYGMCPNCKKLHQFKAIGKSASIKTQKKGAYLIQKCEGGFVLREYLVNSVYDKGNFTAPGTQSKEVRRVIYGDDCTPISTYWYGLYKNVEMRWVKTENLRYYTSPFLGTVYPHTILSLSKRELSKTGLPEFVRGVERVDPEVYLLRLQTAPYIEQLVKAGLIRLTNEIVNKNSNDRMEFPENDSLSKRLGINNLELRRLRLNDGGRRFLEWLRHERSINKNISDEVINWFCDKNITPAMIDFIRNRMSDMQVCNYLKRQIAESGRSAKEMVSTWADYLIMAARLKMNVNDAIVYKPKKLIQRHDELVAMFEDKESAILAGELAEKYPDVDSVCESVKAKYEYDDGQFAIVAPTCIEEIISEGTSLHHCGGKSERYYDRIQNREAYILFLRKTEDVDKPWYTLEVEPDGTIRQKRTEFDRQKDDLKEALPFLEKWQTIVAKRLSEEDIALAARSTHMREMEFKELREKQVKIQGTVYDGQLLADLLEADLMEPSKERRNAG